MKDCLSLPGFRWKNFNSIRTDEAEPIYTYNEKYMKWFVSQSIKGGGVCAYSHYYKSKACENNLKCISEEKNVKGNIYDFIKGYLNHKTNHLEIIKNKMKIISTFIEI